MQPARHAPDFSALTPLIKGHYATFDAPLFAGRFRESRPESNIASCQQLFEAAQVRQQP
jgi:hypothetical protein